MNEAQAVQDFLGGFGIPAYAETSVPSDAEYPYLTYGLVVGSWLDAGDTSVQVNLWYYTESEAVPNAKVREIAEAIGMGGVCLPCDGGFVWVKRGSPFAQSVAEENDKIKRRYINIDLEYNIVR